MWRLNGLGCVEVILTEASGGGSNEIYPAWMDRDICMLNGLRYDGFEWVGGWGLVDFTHTKMIGWRMDCLSASWLDWGS